MNKAAIDRLKLRYQNGTRVELIQMDDPQAPPSGTKGTVLAVDDIGNILVNWDNGSGLNLVPETDRFRVISK